MRCPRCKLNNDASATNCYNCDTLLDQSVLTTGVPADKLKNLPTPANPGPFDEYTPSWMLKNGDTPGDNVAPLLSQLLEETTPPPRRFTSAVSAYNLSVEDLINNRTTAKTTTNSDEIARARPIAAQTSKNSPPLPAWLGEITRKNLPRKPGYIIFRNDNRRVVIARHANPLRQLQAAVIDLILFAVFLAFISIIIGVILYLTNNKLDLLINGWRNYWEVAAVIYAGYHINSANQSFGKSVVGISLVNREGQMPAKLALFVRALYGALLMAGGFTVAFYPQYSTAALTAVVVLALGCLLAVFGAYKRGLHDIIAGTYPINLRGILQESKHFEII